MIKTMWTIIAISAIACASLANPQAAQATPSTSRVHSAIAPSLSSDQADAAISEARAGGAVLSDVSGSDGSETVTIGVGDGVTMTVIRPSERSSKLATGSDAYGVFVAFNATDQNMIISGAAAGLTAGICLLGPVVCAVATVAVTIATVAMTQNGGIRCGTKALRVYPFSGHDPRCA